MAADNRRRTPDRAGLGEFLRARRARVTPTEVGLAPGPGLRRTPGLRREELAAVAGVSVDYYIRLEQGKETRPSAAVLDALARALRLGTDERAHLHALAEQAARHSTAPRPNPVRTVRPVLRRMLTSLLPAPAYVLSRTSDILAANPPGLRLFAGLDEWPAERRNTIRYLFLHPAARSLFPQWERVAAESVAHLRTVAGTDPDAPDLTALVGELVVKSDEFATMWRRYDVRLKATGRKEYEHPDVGRFGLDYEVLSPARADGQRLVAYQAEPGTPDHDAMLLLALAAGADERQTPSEPAAHPVEPAADPATGRGTDD
jgi:transcriptional regulator with XRE-family HTH domain